MYITDIVQLKTKYYGLTLPRATFPWMRNYAKHHDVSSVVVALPFLRRLWDLRRLFIFGLSLCRIMKRIGCPVLPSRVASPVFKLISVENLTRGEMLDLVSLERKYRGRSVAIVTVFFDFGGLSVGAGSGGAGSGGESCDSEDIFVENRDFHDGDRERRR